MRWDGSRSARSEMETRPAIEWCAPSNSLFQLTAVKVYNPRAQFSLRHRFESLLKWTCSLWSGTPTYFDSSSLSIYLFTHCQLDGSKKKKNASGEKQQHKQSDTNRNDQIVRFMFTPRCGTVEMKLSRRLFFERNYYFCESLITTLSAARAVLCLLCNSFRFAPLDGRWLGHNTKEKKSERGKGSRKMVISTLLNEIINAFRGSVRALGSNGALHIIVYTSLSVFETQKLFSCFTKIKTE